MKDCQETYTLKAVTMHNNGDLFFVENLISCQFDSFAEGGYAVSLNTFPEIRSDQMRLDKIRSGDRDT